MGDESDNAAVDISSWLNESAERDRLEAEERKAAAERAEAERIRQHEERLEGYRSGSFKPGVSGNPGGRPKDKGLATAVRQAVDPLAMVDFMVSVMNGSLEGVTVKERMEAVKWLADRGHGKAVETVRTVETDADPLDELSNAELRDLIKKK